VLATGAALSATGFLVATMASASQPAADVNLVRTPATIATAPAAPALPPPTTIVIIHRPAASPAASSGTRVVAAPSVGRATPAPRPAAPAPAPVAKSSGS
jgi:hypothetical protein